MISDIQQQFQDDYNNVGIKTNTSIPLDQSPTLNNAGVKSVIGTSDNQTTEEPISSSGTIRNSSSVGYLTGTGWWLGIDRDGLAKMFIGSATGNRITWDGATLNIVGNISASSIDIPDTTTANSFHTDVNGNSWWGATTFATAPAKISNAGVATFSGLNIINTFTAGENITAGKLLCFKNTLAAWGNDATASRSTTALISDMAYTDSHNANTNFPGTNLSFQGQDASNFSLTTYLKLNLSANPPGLPLWYQVDTVYLRLYVVIASGSGFTTPTLSLSRVTSAWTEGTITYNSSPTNDGVVWSSAALVTTPFDSETLSANVDGTSTGYLDFDITALYRLWSLGTYTNYGVVVNGTAAGPYSLQFGGRSRTAAEPFNQAPYLATYITQDSPGTGNPGLVASDGKVYLASALDYQKVQRLAGIAGASVSAGQSISVYGLTDGSLVPNSIVSTGNAQDYFLTDSGGTINTLSNNILEDNRWNVHVGVGSPNGLIIRNDQRPLFIKSNSLPKQLPPPNSTMVKMIWNAEDVNGRIFAGSNEAKKGFQLSASSGSGSGAGASLVQATGTLTWNTGSSGVIDASVICNLGGADNSSSKSFTLYFYK